MEKYLDISNQSINYTIFDETRPYEVAYYFNVCLLSIGLVNNFVCFFVFLNKNLRKRKFNWYLLALAVFEFLFCLIGFIDYIFVKVHKQEIFLHDLHKLSYMIINYIIHTSDSCVSILTLLVSMDRLYAIKNPMKIKEFFTCRHAIKTITSSLFVLILLKTLSFCFCESNINSELFIVYCSLISPILFNTIPLTMILIINGLLAKEMLQNKKIQQNYQLNESQLNFEGLSSRRNTRAMSKRNKSVITINKIDRRESSNVQKSHYIVILVLSIWSVFTSIPYYSFNTYFSLFRLKLFSSGFHLKTVVMTQTISSVLFNSNHCVNFFMYLLFYSEFRSILRNTFIKMFSK